RYLSGTIAKAGEPCMIDRFLMIGAHQQWGEMWCNMTQVRLWKKALTAGQIQNNMYFELDASHPDLVAFWRMEEGPSDFDGVFYDATGNGHDLVDPDWMGNSSVVGWDGPYSFGD
ncbi:MAG: hypothetical protein LUE10_01640, partial [Alistipes sp.]|nr:hypothetical protein [Alistipes sp.]